MKVFLRGMRQAFTIARRDFAATVFTPTFLLFLLAPVFMIVFALVGGMGARGAAESTDARERMVVIASSSRAAEITAIDSQLRKLFPSRGDNALPELVIEAPANDVAAQARAMFDSTEYDLTAVLHGPLERPRILRGPRDYREANYLAELAEQVLRVERSGGTQQLSQAEIAEVSRGQSSVSGRSQLAYVAVLGIFFLTLMLSGQAVGAMAEERSNKVIEVLAAAVPLESVFFGKLLGAFGTAVLFVAFWGTLLGNLPKLLPANYVSAFSELGAAVGYPLFPLLFVAYFTMAYMLLSAVFLGVGALASTQREIQMLSLPITIIQVVMLGFASYGAIAPNSWVAIAAQVFPFSSPSAMAARAANSPEIWPHVAALIWQALWVGITVTIGARVFRRGVLKSGSPRIRLRGR
ncbi:ABC transporter permease [Sphingomonas canadensis]|uniref:ABC transporter permease n=1 Tax=Sphingomonas canadensis TaxID=1219257 RepID=A0ABW3HBS6_9SPHN|nr:ABC transporter permease [Sphingomonas canadensis]MCW3836455.1 ABC transporter permease [Sphingomonas canadensis]